MLDPIVNEVQQIVKSDDNNINNDNYNSKNWKPILHKTRDEIFLEFFGNSVKEFLTNCGLTEEQVTTFALVFTDMGMDVNDLPLLTMSNLRQIISDQFIVLKITQRITSYYLKILSNVNN